MSDLERELDRLYGLPLAEFTPARNELARLLKTGNDEKAATEIQALPKPSLAAWVINQLSRREPKAVGELLDAGAALRTAQERLLQRSGDAASLRDAMAREREAVERLVRRTPKLLEDAGRTVTPATLERITRTLQTAAVDEAGRRLLKTGRLTAELEPPGFEAFTGLAPGAVKQGSQAHDELAKRRREQEKRRQQKRELQQKARDLEQAARQAEHDAEQAAAAATEAQRLADKARAAADNAAASLDELL
jgi:hypothetical protein